MKRISAIFLFLSLSLFGCGSETSNVDNSGNSANAGNTNAVNSVTENAVNANGTANRVTAPESRTSTANSSMNQTRRDTNVNSAKKPKSEGVIESADKKVGDVINNQNGAVKKLKKNVDKLIKDLP